MSRCAVLVISGADRTGAGVPTAAEIAMGCGVDAIESVGEAGGPAVGFASTGGEAARVGVRPGVGGGASGVGMGVAGPAQPASSVRITNPSWMRLNRRPLQAPGRRSDP